MLCRYYLQTHHPQKITLVGLTDLASAVSNTKDPPQLMQILLLYQTQLWVIFKDVFQQLEDSQIHLLEGVEEQCRII